ncbi:MAG: dATP pyrophosphohydrolase [Parcubacteria group bacterium GW2011_GWF2_38_76]|nr:MAG: dATP pyrophosphohydrolase [Parcubacteria group bacterium GW2011_GWF2_38_76]
MNQDITKRSPFQVLIFPFIKEGANYLYAVFCREDMGIWQGIAGGGEGDEKPIEAAKREAYEEAGINKSYNFIRLSSMTTIPAENIHGLIWGKDIVMIPEFSFGVEVSNKELKTSHEHIDYHWLPLKESIRKLRYDSNKSALWELDYRLKNKSLNGITNNMKVIRDIALTNQKED